MYLFQVFFLENKLKLCIHPYTSQWNKIYTENNVFICGHSAVGTIIVKQVLVTLVTVVCKTLIWFGHRNPAASLHKHGRTLT